MSTTPHLPRTPFSSLEPLPPMDAAGRWPGLNLTPAGAQDSFPIANRRAIIGLFLGTVLIATVAAAAYVIGRRSGFVTPTITARAPEVILVDPPVVTPPVVNQPAKPAPIRRATVRLPVPPPEPPPVAPAHLPENPAAIPAASVVANPDAGTLYFQVAAVEVAMANQSAEFLRAKGLPVRIAPGVDAGHQRILVGPMSGAESVAKTQSALESAGFRPFLRRY